MGKFNVVSVGFQNLTKKWKIPSLIGSLNDGELVLVHARLIEDFKVGPQRMLESVRLQNMSALNEIKKMTCAIRSLPTGISHFFILRRMIIDMFFVFV